MRLTNISYCHLELSVTDVDGTNAGFHSVMINLIDKLLV